MAKKKLYWQGEEVKATHCRVKVYPDDNPLTWYNYECMTSGSVNAFTLLEALRIETKRGRRFYISNHAGIGLNKLRKGGWSNQTHFSFPDTVEEVRGSESYGDGVGIWYSYRFSEAEYSLHESERRAWQKKNYPREYEELQALRQYNKQRIKLADSYGRKA